MYVLVFTLITTGQVAFYSGDLDNRQAGRPTMYQSQSLCEETRGPQQLKMELSRQQNPKLPAFTLTCMSLDAAPPSTPPEIKKQPETIKDKA
jgi:hypothetical protein